ncbi:MAG: hypothetical protein FWB86_02195 [Treponema sp.]|nr:hypothetical protein [Treponema sp.]MCL2250972.1 hypothetical protein [Treponema sp.]
MSIFCLLWVPFFYLFRRSFSHNGGSGVWALILGSITAIIQFFLGYIISPGGFGFSRFLFGFVDLVSVPVLIPCLIYLIILIYQKFSKSIDFANFALLWLIPVGALRAISWGSTNDPIFLIMTPLLWVAVSMGISFFINLMISKFRWYTVIVSIICILILPALSCIIYWAFFSQQTMMGFGLLIAIHIPLGLSLLFDIKKSEVTK